MNVTIFGATGPTGHQLISRALAAGHRVTAFVRDPSALQRSPELAVVPGEIDDEGAIELAVAGSSAVLCALGGRPWRRRERVCSTAMDQIVPAMIRFGVRRIIAISTFGAGDTRARLNWFERSVIFGVILGSEVADKEAMEAILSASRLDWTVVRVGRLTNGPLTDRWRAIGDDSMPGMGTISRADVADFMLHELTARRWVRRLPALMY